MDEETLKSFCKERIEEEMEKRDLRVVQWFEEASIQTMERAENVPPGTVHERIDLIAVAHKGNQNPIVYVIEVKDEFNKKAVGQCLMYAWALQKVKEVKVNGEITSIPDNSHIRAAICCRKGIQYQGEFIQELNEEFLQDWFDIDLYNIDVD